MRESNIGATTHQHYYEGWYVLVTACSPVPTMTMEGRPLPTYGGNPNEGVGRYTYAPTPRPGVVYIDGFMELMETLGHALNTMTTVEKMYEEHALAKMMGVEGEQYDLPDVDLDKMFFEVLGEAYDTMLKVENGFEHMLGAMANVYQDMMGSAVRDGESIQSILLSARIILNIMTTLIQRYFMEKGITPVLRKAEDDGPSDEGH